MMDFGSIWYGRRENDTLRQLLSGILGFFPFYKHRFWQPEHSGQ